MNKLEKRRLKTAARQAHATASKVVSDKVIAFIGDSFCASFNGNSRYSTFHASPVNNSQAYNAQYGHPSLVADHYGYKLLAHGYMGKSWWYSRTKFLEQIKQQPEILTKLEAIIFFHTDANRCNTLNQFVHSINSDPALNDWENEEHRQVVKAQRQWTKHLMDTEFQTWAQNSWFKEISKEYSHIKQVHFHCFENSTHYNHLLTGQRFTTPLMQISLGELTGTKEQINQSIIRDTRANHLSEHNNRVLAKTIIYALDNYLNNLQALDLTKFNLPNPNYVNFPHQRWRTQL